MTNTKPEEIALNSTVAFRAVNQYMADQQPVWSGTVVRRNKRSVTVRDGLLVCTVPYTHILSVVTA